MKQILLPNVPYPDVFDVEDAVINARLVLQAYAMFDQWEDDNQPRRNQFNWQQPEPPVTGLRYSDPLWAKYRYSKRKLRTHPHGPRKTEWIDKACPIGFLATHHNWINLVFRGTVTDYEWTHVNLPFLQKDDKDDKTTGGVHRGFLRYYTSIREDIQKELKRLNLKNKRFMVTGHSLGGALATLAAREIAEKAKPGTAIILNTFASPRVFDLQAAKDFEKLRLTAFRIVNVEDIVNSVPLANAKSIDYQHIGTPISFSAHYGSTTENHSMDNYLYAIQNPDKPQK